MGLLKTVRLCTLLIIGAAGVPALADKSLDDELDAEWGDTRVKAITVESPKDRYTARLKLLEGRREDALTRCKAKSGGGRYCSNQVEEVFRRDLRGLEKQFEGQIDELPRPQIKPKGFGQG